MFAWNDKTLQLLAILSHKCLSDQSIGGVQFSIFIQSIVPYADAETRFHFEFSIYFT